MKCHKCHKHPFLPIHVALSWTHIPANEHKDHYKDHNKDHNKDNSVVQKNLSIHVPPQKEWSNMNRRSLALQYFPDRSPVEAVRSLRRMIAGCPQLVAALNDLGIDYKKKKNLTVRQARLIMEYLGDP